MRVRNRPDSLPSAPALSAAEAASFSDRLFERIGMPSSLAWGFVGLFLFMIGDGVESGFLSPYLISRGHTVSHVAWIFTAYGFVAGLAGWLSGSLSDAWGPRRVITIGLAAWLMFQVCFLTFGLRHGFLAILLTYGPRGLGYPLFAFGFMVWITVIAPQQRLASAMGWFWLAFAAGLPTLGSLVASIAVPRLGAVGTLWLATGFVAAGGLILLLGVRVTHGTRHLLTTGESTGQALWKSISLLWRKPKTGIACVARIINTAPEFGFFVFLPLFFMHVVGLSLVQWLNLLTMMFLSNVVWNMLFGQIADRIGWVLTLSLFGGLGCALTTLAVYYVPLWRHSFVLALVACMLYGATLAAFVPLSAMMPCLAPEEKGASLSLLSLGAGASVSVGPALVGLFLPHFGIRGVIWLFSLLYLVSAVLALQLRIEPQAPGQTPAPTNRE